MSTRDYRDHVIGQQAIDVQRAIERLRDLESERDVYHQIACEAVHQLGETTRRLSRIRELYERERDQHRALRAQLLRAEAA